MPIGRVMIGVIVLVAIAVLIVLNAGAVVPFNLFGYTVPEVPVIVIAIAGFILGVLFSLLHYLMRAVARARRSRARSENDRLRERVQEAEAAAAQTGEAGARPSANGSAGEKAAAPARRSFFARLFGAPDTGAPI